MRTVKQYNLIQCGERKPDDVWLLFHCFSTENQREPRGEDFQKKKGPEGAADEENEEQGTNKLTEI